MAFSLIGAALTSGKLPWRSRSTAHRPSSRRSRRARAALRHPRDADKIVPLEANSALLKQRYEGARRHDGIDCPAGQGPQYVDRFFPVRRAGGLREANARR